MTRKYSSEYNAFHLFLGLLLGFLLGSTVIYWHTNRQTDRLLSEVMEKVVALFSANNIQVEKTRDNNLIIVKDKDHQRRNVRIPQVSIPQRNYHIPVAENDIQIANDRLLFTRILTLPSESNSTNRRLDSLMGNTSPNNHQLIFIEFWESPLNSLGYKMGKRKILIYGIKNWDLVTLATYQGKIYLRYLDEYYPLNYTNSFRPLVPVNHSTFSQEIHHF
jgi:hypothetical protein